jgi:hypothetical protein
MFVVVPLDDEAEPKPFLSAKAAKEWAETGAFQEFGVEQSEIHFVDGEVSKAEAIAAVKAGKSEKRATVHRRMSAHEIEVNSRREAEAELRDLGLEPKEK